MASFRRTGETCSCCGKHPLFGRLIRTSAGAVRVDICPSCDFMKQGRCGAPLSPKQTQCCGRTLEPMPQTLGLIDPYTEPPGGWGR